MDSTDAINIESVINENAALRELTEHQAQEIENLKLLVQKFRAQAFGKKSEKLRSISSPAQGEQEEMFSFESMPESPEADKSTIEVRRHKREIPRGRKPLPSDLPRERIEYEPEERTCNCCGAELEKIGEEITEELEYIPARFLVKEHVKIKRACGRCKESGVKTGTLPPSVQPLERSRPGAGLLTHIIVSKYMDHLPLYRQEAIFARLGIVIARARMCDWIAAVCNLLEPLHKALRLELIALSYLQADETTIKVQDPENPKHILTGYFWGLHAPPQKLAYFGYYASRAGASAEALLKDFKGTVQTDLYAGYNPVLIPGEVTRLACMAHVRRKFIEVQKQAGKQCGEVLELIAKLYRIETQAKDFEAFAREALRKEKSVPLLERLEKYLLELKATTLPKHALMKALNYALSQWGEIKRYTENGIFEIDNNPIERDIRPIALGRKNFLFAGSHDGAKRAAMLYSFFACCKLRKINPSEWLKDVIIRVQTDSSVSARDLLPHLWKPAQM